MTGLENKADRHMKPLGLYVHWPFCLSKCPYCDFNSHVQQSIKEEQWKNALLTEMKHYAELSKEYQLKTIFFGGGTPSLMQPKTVNRLIDQAKQLWSYDPNIEITLEANPTSYEADKFLDFKSAGVNRVSIGVQSLTERFLKFLKREHSVDQAIQAVLHAGDVFDRFSFDLIYALPEQNLIEWKQDLQQALYYVKDHISLYQLTIEPGTAFYTSYNRGDFSLPSDDEQHIFYDETYNILEQKGLNAYEVSNFSKPGQESRHNMIYWNYDDYIGIGPGAHGRLQLNQQKYATYQKRHPQGWLEEVIKNGHATKANVIIDPKERAKEMLMMGLRVKEGIHKLSFQEKCQISIDDFLPEQKLIWLQEEGYLVNNTEKLYLTFEGRMRINQILSYLI